MFTFKAIMAILVALMFIFDIVWREWLADEWLDSLADEYSDLSEWYREFSGLPEEDEDRAEFEVHATRFHRKEKLFGLINNFVTKEILPWQRS